MLPDFSGDVGGNAAASKVLRKGNVEGRKRHQIQLEEG